MKKVILHLLFILQANYLSADGPPVDSTGKVFCNHISIQLDSSQVAHLQSNRWLELSDSQRKKLSFLNLPKYIDILDPYHRDCVCGQIYAMWYSADSLAFCIEDTNNIAPFNESEEEYKAYNNFELLKKTNPNHLFITASGQLNYLGEIVETKNIKEKLNAIKLRKNDKIKYIRIYQPPLKNNTTKDKVYATKSKLVNLIPADITVIWL